MAAHKFKGKDRRILEKSSQLMDAIDARDVRAGDPKPTSAISTRMKIIDTGDSDLVQAWEMLRARIAALLAM